MSDKNKLSYLRKVWLLWLIVLVISAYLIPYKFLGQINKITASFLFWTFFALVAIASIFRIINYWRE